MTSIGEAYSHWGDACRHRRWHAPLIAQSRHSDRRLADAFLAGTQDRTDRLGTPRPCLPHWNSGAFGAKWLAVARKSLICLNDLNIRLWGPGCLRKLPGLELVACGRNGARRCAMWARAMGPQPNSPAPHN